MKQHNATYQRLGDYIREVDVRNKDLKVTKLMGVNIGKFFMPSVANVIGTDLSNYKVVYKGQFASNLMHVGRDGKIPIAMYELEEPIIVSPAYFVFEVIDIDILLPSYLMMWLQRTDFDRQACFFTDGDVRGGLSKDAFLNMTLPIPPIARQREIVAEYAMLANRIRLNNRLISTLESTAQALYRKMFVDNIDKDHLPDGWRMGTLTDIAEYLNGLPCQTYETKEADFFPVLKIRELSQGFCDETSNHVKGIPKEFVIENGDIIFSWSATLTIDIWCGGQCALNQHLFKVIPKEYPKWFVYLWTKSHIDEWKHLISAKATSMGHIKREDLTSACVLIPPNEIMTYLDGLFEPIIKTCSYKKQEILQLTELQSLLLAKMGG